MKKLLICLLLLFTVSCIPLQNAPDIKDYEIVLAKKFKRDLPSRYAFVFQDQMDADMFYQFFIWKFGRIDVDLHEDMPFQVGDSTFYITFYERQKKSVTLNLLPLVIDAVAMSSGGDPVIDDYDIVDKDNEIWYILIMATDSEYNDCLKPSYVKQNELVEALRELMEEYNNTELIYPSAR